MKPRPLALLLLPLALGTTGCAAWMSLQTEAGVTSSPDAVFTQKVDAGVGIGSSGGRVYAEIGGGIGYRAGGDSPHADLHLQVGYETGKAVRWGLGLVGSGRVGPGYWVPTEDPLVLRYVDGEFGGGVAGHMFVRVPPDSPSPAGLYFGAAGTAEIVGQGKEDDPHVHFLGTLGPALRYVFDDSTEAKFHL